ncbi:MAG: exodeoxyribonuclease V subunit gamma [Chitinivibrionales bacterium]
MLHLHFAPSSDLLLPTLLTSMQKVWKDPFAPPTVIVPSPAVGKWLQLRLADCPVESEGRPLALGCIANLEMQTLERFLWKALSPSENMQRLDAAVLQQVVCALLNDKLLENPHYGAIRAYLINQDNAIDPIKKVQLASKIARQFQEYEFNRPSVWDAEAHKWKRTGIDACWLEKKHYHGLKDQRDKTDSNESWQMDLYLRVHECLRRGFTDSTGNPKKPLSLPHLYRLRRERGLENGEPWTVPPGTIYLFQVSKISHFHRNTLVEISQMPGVDMHVYLTNPCAEFWEDVDTWRSHKYPRAWKYDSPQKNTGVPSRKPDEYGTKELEDFAHLPKDPAPLELWGRAGKENIYLWCPQVEWNFEYLCPDWVERERPPDTLLKALQLALLRRESTLPGTASGRPWKDDDSLQVLACPDPAREVEELREQVLDLVEKNKIQRLNEIVVYLPDPATYVSQIHRVFDAFSPGDPGYIPYSVLGAPGSNSLFAQGILTLLEIVEGRFDRAHVFALLRNPLVQSTREIPPDSVAIWEEWAEELGIFRGFNKEHRARMGDKGQTITDAHTFEFGMARLLIGNLAEGPVDMKYRLLADDLASPIPAFRDFNTSDADSVEKFCSLVEALYSDVERLYDSLENSGAVDAIAGLVWDWFGTVPEDTPWNMTAEGRVRGEFLDALPALNGRNDLALRKDPIGLMEFLALLRECLPEELPSGSRAWTGGITFAPLRPAMIVPHKVIFVLGLDATAFPGTNEKPGWDLLAHNRIVGDSDQVRDNRFAFLELLHAAQERLVLSFRSRDMQKEEALQPSSVVLELESYLKDQGLKEKTVGQGEDRCLIRREIPLIIHESIENIKKSGRLRGTWDPSEVRLACIEGIPGIKKAMHRYGTAVQFLDNTTRGPLRTTIYHLRTFFANPLEYHLSKTLGIELDEQPTTMSATDEPLQSDALDMSGLQKTIWTELLFLVFPESMEDAWTDTHELGDEAEKIAGKAHREYCVRGGSPEAQLCFMERQYLVRWARDCAEATVGLRETFIDHRLMQNVDLSLNRQGASGELEVDLGEGRTCSVECRHGLALLPRNASGTMGILHIKNEGHAKDNPDLWLTGVLQGLAEQKLPEINKFAIRLVQLNRGDGECDCAAIKRENIDTIMHWLVIQIQDMLLRHCADHLPFEVIRDLTKQDRKKGLSWKDRWAGVTNAAFEEKLSDDEHGYISYLEAFKLVDARIPDKTDDDLRDLAKARFAPFLEGLVHE